MKVIEGAIVASDACIAIAVARFNQFISNNLLKGSIDVLKRIGQVQDDNITIVWIPGVYELPLTIMSLANTNKYDAIIALGSVIQGDTINFEVISNACSLGLSKISMNHLLPIAFGVLTTNTIEQAIERIGIKGFNKGVTAAMSALEMINVLKLINIFDE